MAGGFEIEAVAQQVAGWLAQTDGPKSQVEEFSTSAKAKALRPQVGDHAGKQEIAGPKCGIMTLSLTGWLLYKIEV